MKKQPPFLARENPLGPGAGFCDGVILVLAPSSPTPPFFRSPPRFFFSFCSVPPKPPEPQLFSSSFFPRIPLPTPSISRLDPFLFFGLGFFHSPNLMRYLLRIHCRSQCYFYLVTPFGMFFFLLESGSLHLLHADPPILVCPFRVALITSFIERPSSFYQIFQLFFFFFTQDIHGPRPSLVEIGVENGLVFHTIGQRPP